MESSGASLQQLNSRLPLLATPALLEDVDRWPEATIVPDDFLADGTCTTEGSSLLGVDRAKALIGVGSMPCVVRTRS